MNSPLTRRKANKAFYGYTALMLLLVFLCAAASIAATEAGTIIKNQASASYRDTQGIQRVATSNVVETLIRQVAALTLTRDQSKPGAAGTEIYFSHSLTNTGNGPDSFELTIQHLTGDTFDLENLSVYPDDDRDGIPDDLTPITQTLVLGPDASQSFVVGGTVPTGAVNGDISQLQINATSNFDGGVVASNTDIATVTDSAVIQLTKSISGLQGASPDGPFTVTLNYQNTSNVAATQVTLIDALPEGMTYVAGSGRWSDIGSVVLTDANPTDSHSGITYCAYDAGCTGLPEANSDADADSTNQVTAIIATVAAGQAGQLEFEVTIDASLPASLLYNTAETEYRAGSTLVGRINSNSVPFRILQGVNVVLNGSSTSQIDGAGEPAGLLFAADGEAMKISNIVWNRGNSVDTFDITITGSNYPTGTVFTLLQADGQTPLLDTSGNGVPDTGPIKAGAYYEVVLQVLLPTGLNGLAAETTIASVTTVATSVSDPSVSNSMLNELNYIVGGSVDITNDAPLGDPLATGTDIGPEDDAVNTFTANAGATMVVPLFINNISQSPLEFDLSASIYSDFSSVELPEGWRVQFTFPDNTIVSTTGIIASGEHAVVLANVRSAVDAVAGTTSIYFRAHNEHYSLSDIKHDAFMVTDSDSLLLGTSQEGQTEAGGSNVYHHTLINASSADINNIALSVTDSLASEGWNSIVYEDTDGDSELGAADQLISLTNLAAGESKTLFVKVFAPSSAGPGDANRTDLTAVSPTSTLIVSDTTSVSSGEITVVKEQALDSGCNGVLDSAYSLNAFSVEPGNNCVSYRLTAANNGSATVLNVLVADATPIFTTYSGTATCSKLDCLIDEPPVGGEGDVTASLSSLEAGDSVVVEFMVKVE